MKITQKFDKFLWILVIFIFLTSTMGLFARPKENKRISFNKTTVLNPARTLSNIANWTYWMQWDGQSGRDPVTGSSGGFYPPAASSTIFADGFIWAGITTEPGATRPLRAGGSSYISGAVPGYINSSGNRVTPDDDSDIRIYRIRADWRTLTASQVRKDAAELNNVTESTVSDAQIQEVLEQYKQDWINWPVDLGAPFEDVNDNGIYDPVLDNQGAAIASEGDHPGIADADQVIWFVANDFSSSQTNEFLGAEPLGLEYQVTAWAYNQASARLGQIIFKKYKFINKSGFLIDSMYVSQWSDPDLGNFGDDVVGNDSTLSLGFVYNGSPNDDQYAQIGLPPASAGYDFFQGPIVESPGDTAVFDLKKRPGFRNLPMTSFAFFAAGDPVISDPPLGDYDGTRGWYNLLRGFIPTFDVENPTPFTHRAGPLTGRVTKFPLNGDPVAQTGDLDAQGGNLAPGDRRLLLNTGPFDLPTWEDQNGDGLANFPEPGVQEIVVALIGGVGDDWLGSVAEVKATDEIAQRLYDDLFLTVPKPPPSPDVEAVPFREKIVLNWGTNQDAVAATEADNPRTGYDFEGYNVYQFPSANASLDQATRIATFDKVNGITTIMGKKLIEETGRVETVAVQQGTDNGIKRHITIDQNFITGEALFPGNSYFFAVTAYNYNDFTTSVRLIEDSTLESSATIMTVVPQDPKPGTILPTDPGATVEVDHSQGASDGQVQVNVIDPTALTGDDYTVFFEEFNDTTFVTDSLGNDSMVVETLVGWNVRNESTGRVVVRDQKQTGSLDERQDQPIFEGIQVKVAGPPLTFKSFQVVANGSGPLDPPLPGGLNFAGFPTPGNANPGEDQQVGDGHWGVHQTDNTDGSFESFVGRVSQYSGGFGLDPGIHNLIPDDFEIRFTEDGGQGFFNWTTETVESVPFEIWNIGDADDPDDDLRLFPWVLDIDEDTGVGEFNLNAIDHAVSSAENDPFTDGIYWVEPIAPGDEGDGGEAGYNRLVAAHQADPAGAVGATLWAIRDDGTWQTVPSLMRVVLVNWNGLNDDGTFNQDMPETGTIFRIVTTKPNTTNDQFTFGTPQSSFSQAAAKEDVEKINVFPNPYYAFNPEETSRFDRFVTFSHLPDQATLRIFNLAGDLVRTIEKNSESQFQKWDLRNESNFPVASGLYIVHIEMPELNKEKALKVFIIQHEEILEFF